MVSDLQYLEDWEEKAHRLNEWMNDKGVCRTAPSTPGLLNRNELLIIMQISQVSTHVALDHQTYSALAQHT